MDVDTKLFQPFYFVRSPACINRSLHPAFGDRLGLGSPLHLFHEPVSLFVPPVLKFLPVVQYALLFPVLEQANVALHALLPTIILDILYKLLEPLRLPVPPSSPILMLSEIFPVRPLCLENTLSSSGNGYLIQDDICVILRLIQEIETRLAGAVGRPPAVLNETIVSFVFIAETRLTRFFFINRIVGIWRRARTEPGPRACGSHLSDVPEVILVPLVQ